jgi:hypothetical protein
MPNFRNVLSPRRKGMSAETTSAMTSMNAFELVGIRMGIDPSNRRRSSPNIYTLLRGLGWNVFFDKLQYALAYRSPITVLSAPVSMHTPL